MVHGALTGLGNVRGLITVPGTIALAIWSVAFVSLRLDEWLISRPDTEAYWLLRTDYQTAIAILSTIAGAAITTLSLVYSLVLLVFTLAAGTIAPRLLQRFTSDRVNQVTAGILGGLFLFALTILHQTDQAFIPVLSIGLAFGLAALAVLQLIFFVHTVARSVTIDEEIAEISQQLEDRLARIMAENEDDDRSFKFDRRSCTEIGAQASGYITRIDGEMLLAIANEHDVSIEIANKTGVFHLKGQTLATVSPAVKGEQFDAITEVMTQAIELMPTRGSVEDVEYAISVLLEIALRALSPGVNDTFTAIACVDRLSAAFVAPVRMGLRRRLLTDEDGTVRVRIAGMTIEDMINTAFHPLRRVSAGNLLMLQNVADALKRLHDIADEDVEPIFEGHARLLMESFRQTEPLSTDEDYLKERLSPLLKGKDD